MRLSSTKSTRRCERICGSKVVKGADTDIFLPVDTTKLRMPDAAAPGKKALTDVAFDGVDFAICDAVRLKATRGTPFARDIQCTKLCQTMQLGLRWPSPILLTSNPTWARLCTPSEVQEGLTCIGRHEDFR